jgi:hypothetical protein
VAAPALVQPVVGVLLDERRVIAVAPATGDLERKGALGVRGGHLALHDLTAERRATVGVTSAIGHTRASLGGRPGPRFSGDRGAHDCRRGGRLWRSEGECKPC